MSINYENEKPFTFRFIDTKPRILLELVNNSETALRSIEILTIFLKDEETSEGLAAQSHIRFDPIKSLNSKESAVLSHRTWTDGRPVNDERDQMARLKMLPGEFKPYVLDISWQNAEGRARFQRIPVGH